MSNGLCTLTAAALLLTQSARALRLADRLTDKEWPVGVVAREVLCVLPLTSLLFPVIGLLVVLVVLVERCTFGFRTQVL